MVYTFGCNLYVSAFFGFTISLIFNYLASMAFVFQRKDDASRTKEFIIFAVLSVIGLGLNELIIWVCVLINDHFVAGHTNFFAMAVNWINIVVFAAVILVVGLVIRSMIRDKKAGKSSCGGNCGSCAGCAGCSACQSPGIKEGGRV